MASFSKSEQVRFDLFPRFLRHGAVFAKGISYRSHLDQHFRVLAGFPAFRVEVFIIRAIRVICGGCLLFMPFVLSFLLSVQSV
jgi:hypothetical protein